MTNHIITIYINLPRSFLNDHYAGGKEEKLVMETIT